MPDVRRRGLDWYDRRSYHAVMAVAKIAVSLDPRALERVDRLVRSGVFPSRSKAIQDALAEKLDRLEHSRLARECAKLDPTEEKEWANERWTADLSWPEY